jgi:hypothetical protein
MTDQSETDTTTNENGSSPSSAAMKSYMERLEDLQDEIEEIQNEMEADGMPQASFLLRAWMQLEEAVGSIHREERSM